MNLYLLTGRPKQKWDVYSQAVVVAESEEAARNIHPSGGPFKEFPNDRDWVRPEEVQVDYLGVACEVLQPNSVVCASYHAG